jgi:hypothetical protein
MDVVEAQTQRRGACVPTNGARGWLSLAIPTLSRGCELHARTGDVMKKIVQLPGAYGQSTPGSGLAAPDRKAAHQPLLAGGSSKQHLGARGMASIGHAWPTTAGQAPRPVRTLAAIEIG